MAIPENRTTFKIGDKTYLYDDFANFYNTHKQSYYDYARERGGFSQEYINQLDAEIAKALELAKNGEEFDTTGDFNGNNVQNITVIKKRLGKDKEIQQGLTGRNSWLTNFIAKAGQHMNEYTEDKSDQDFNNYTLGAYLKGTGQNAEQIFSSYDKAPDEDDIYGREFNERGRPTYDFLTGYRKFLQSTNFDFANDSNIYNDDHMTILDNAIKMFETTDDHGNIIFNKNFADNFDVNQLTQYLNQLGANLGGDYDYTRALTSDQYKYPTEEEIAKMNADKEAAETKRRKDEEEAAAKAVAERTANEENFRTTQRTNWVDLYGRDENYYGRMFDFNPVIYDTNGSFVNANNSAKRVLQEDMASAYNNLINALINNNIDLYNNNNVNKDWVLPYALENSNNNQFTDLGDDQYLINRTFSKDNNGWGLIYNKKTNDVYWDYLGNRKYKNHTNIIEQLERYFNEYIKSHYTNDPNNSNSNLRYHQYYNPDLFPTHYPSVFNKKGGTLIKKYQFGDEVMPISFNNINGITEKTKERAEKNNISTKEQAELDREFKPIEKNQDEFEFNGNDITQLITIGANLGSMFMGPLSGALVGAGATVTDFINDWNRDGFQWRDAKNLITGLGMDAIGMIPVVGDAFGTMGKVTRSLVQYVPKIIGYIGTAGSLANTPEVVNSLKKVGNEKLTVQDWKNIADAVNLIVTGARGTKNTIYSARAKQASLSKPTDGDNFKLQIEIANKNNKRDKKLLILEGDDARKVQNDPTQKNISEILKQDKYKDLKGYEAVPESTLSGVKIRVPWKKIDDPLDSDKKIRAGFSGMIDYKEPSVKIQPYYDPIKFARNYSNRQKDIKRLMYLEPNHGHNGENVYDYSQVGIWRRKQKNKLTKQENKLLSDLYSPRELKSELVNKKREIKSIKKDNNRIKKELNEKSKELSHINNYLKLAKQRDKIKLKNLYDSKKNIEEQLELTEDLDTRMNLIEEKSRISKIIDVFENNSYQDIKNNISDVESTLKTLNQKLKENSNRIHNLNYRKKELSSLKKDPHYLYEDLLNLKTQSKNPEGDLEVIKSQYYNNLRAIKRYYNSLKQGGSIDRNKLNKFLNYGKR